MHTQKPTLKLQEEARKSRRNQLCSWSNIRSYMFCLLGTKQEGKKCYMYLKLDVEMLENNHNMILE